MQRLAGHGGRRVYHLHSGAAETLNHGLQEGIMGAAQHNAVGPGIQQGLQGGAYGGFGLGAIQNAALHQFHEALPHMLHYLHVIFILPAGIEILGALEGAGGGQHANHAALRTQGGGLHGRLHPNEGDGGIFFPQGGYSRRRGGVAGHHDDIGPHSQQDVRYHAGPVLNIGGRFFPVRAMGIVREIEITLPGEDFAELPVDGQAAASGIEYTNRCHTLQS